MEENIRHEFQIYRCFTFIIARSSIGTSVVLFAIIPRVFLKEICIALSISLELSCAAELAAATTVATVPNFAEPLPLKEFTASLCALRTNWVALVGECQHNNIKTYCISLLCIKGK